MSASNAHEAELRLAEAGAGLVARAAQRAVHAPVGQGHRNADVRADAADHGHVAKARLGVGVGNDVGDLSVEHPRAIRLLDGDHGALHQRFRVGLAAHRLDRLLARVHRRDVRGIHAQLLARRAQRPFDDVALPGGSDPAHRLGVFGGHIGFGAWSAMEPLGEAGQIASDPLHASGDDAREGPHEAQILRPQAGPRLAAHAAEGPVHLAVRKRDRHADIGVELACRVQVAYRRLGAGVRDDVGDLAAEHPHAVGLLDREDCALVARGDVVVAHHRVDRLIAGVHRRDVRGVHAQSLLRGSQRLFDHIALLGCLELLDQLGVLLLCRSSLHAAI